MKNKSGRECFQKGFNYTEDVYSNHSWPDSVYTGKKMLTVVVVMMVMKTTNTIMNTNFKLKLSFLHFVAF